MYLFTTVANATVINILMIDFKAVNTCCLFLTAFKIKYSAAFFTPEMAVKIRVRIVPDFVTVNPYRYQ